MSGALGPPISFALLSLFSSSCSTAFLRRGQMLLKLPRACCRFYKTQNKKKACSKCMDLKSHSSSVCFVSPFYCEWGWLGVEVWKGDACAVLAPFMFHLEYFIGIVRRVIDKLAFCITRKCVESFVPGLSWKDSHSILIQSLFVNKYKTEKAKWNADGHDSTAHDVHK